MYGAAGGDDDDCRGIGSGPVRRTYRREVKALSAFKNSTNVTTKNTSEAAIVGKESQRLRLKADAAYSEYMEAFDMFQGDESPEAREWVQELREAWEDLEEELEEVSAMEKMPF